MDTELRMFAGILYSLIKERGFTMEIAEGHATKNPSLIFRDPEHMAYVELDLVSAYEKSKKVGAEAVADETVGGLIDAQMVLSGEKPMAGAVKAKNPTVKIVHSWKREKDRLFLALCPADASLEAYSKRYDGIIGEKDEELGLIVTARLACADGTAPLATQKIAKEDYKKTPKEVFEQAIRSSRKVHPAKVLALEEAKEEAKKCGKTRPILDVGAPGEYVITNEGMEFGAASVCFDKVLKEAYAKIGGRFYLLPDNVHWMVAVPVGVLESSLGPDEVEADKLFEMVKENNKDILKNGWVDYMLTDAVYLYNGEKLTRVR